MRPAATVRRAAATCEKNDQTELKKERCLFENFFPCPPVSSETEESFERFGT